MTLNRIECMGLSINLDEGVKARVADPFWLLGRQWQVGEFRGDDAATPLSVEVSAETVPIVSFRAEGGKAQAVNWDADSPPLETLAEATTPASAGFSGIYDAARCGQILLERLEAARLGTVARDFRKAFRFKSLPASLAAQPRNAAALRMLLRRGIDSTKIIPRRRRKADNIVAAITNRNRQKKAANILENWRTEFAYPEPSGWASDRMEYNFSVAAAAPEGEIVMSAREHHGGDLDWHQFDVGGKSHRIKVRGVKTRKLENRALPTSVAYSGMPAARWWEIEDNDVHMGDIQSGPGDFARLMVAEFATSYSDDWFLIPLRAPRGSLTRITSIKVHDTFGAAYGSPPTSISHISDYDKSRLSSDGKVLPRSFRLYEMSGDPGPSVRRAPWLFVPPVLGSSMEGPALEKVEFTRDEAANTAWAIERFVEGPLGRALDRGRGHAHMPATAQSDKDYWRYRLSQDAPPGWWIPFLPERIKQGAETQLRRGRMLQWDETPDIATGSFGSLLAPQGKPFYIAEEEVPRSGTTVVRRLHYARGIDGTPHLWLENAKRPGRGERSSGLRWDTLDTDAK